MTEPPPENNPEEPPKPNPPAEPGPYTQEIRHPQVTARIPERVGHGIFSTGALVAHGAHEFVIDFVVRVNRPHQIAARVILPPTVMWQFIGALRQNLTNYESRFGPPPALPTAPPPATPPSIEEIYSQLKLPDELLSGTYSNAVLITHTPAEFCLDFITNFYPRSAVSCRVYLSAAHVPGLLAVMNSSFQQFQQKRAQGRPKNGEDKG